MSAMIILARDPLVLPHDGDTEIFGYQVSGKPGPPRWESTLQAHYVIFPVHSTSKDRFRGNTSLLFIGYSTGSPDVVQKHFADATDKAGWLEHNTLVHHNQIH